MNTSSPLLIEACSLYSNCIIFQSVSPVSFFPSCLRLSSEKSHCIWSCSHAVVGLAWLEQLLNFIFILVAFYFYYYYKCAWCEVCIQICMWRPENNFRESVLSTVVSGVWTPISRLPNVGARNWRWALWKSSTCS